MSYDQPTQSQDTPRAGESEHSTPTPSDEQASEQPVEGGQPQNQQTHQQPNQAPPNGGGGQDIRNAQWLTLSRDEEILWWGHPSLIPHLPVMALSLLSAIMGIASVFVLPELGYWSLILVPVGIAGAALDYTRVITSFYVVTTDKVARKVGVLRRNTIEMRYENIEHVNARQSIGERLLGYGDIDLATAGTGDNEATLENVPQPRQVSQTINQQKDDAYNALRNKAQN